MLQMLRKLREQDGWRAAVGRASATLRAAPLVRKLAGDRDALDDALRWCAWGLAGAVALYALWVVGGFGVLVAQGPDASQHQKVVRIAPAEVRAQGCTEASLNRATGRTRAAEC